MTGVTSDVIDSGAATNGQVLTADGSGGVSYAAGGGGGAWTLISSATATNVSSLDFTGIDNTYSTYVLVFDALVPVNNGVVLRLRMGTGITPTWETSGYKHLNSKRISLDGNDDNDFGNNDISGQASLPMSGACGNATGNNISGFLYCFNLPQTTFKHFSGLTPSAQFGGYLQGGTPYGQFTKTSAVTGLRLLFSNGNISSGSARLYGIQD